MLFLSACEVTTPSQVQTGKIRIKDQMIAEMLDAHQVNPGRVKAIANNFVQNGKGGMVLTVSWLAGEHTREVFAEKQGKSFKKAFEQEGAANISVVTVPVTDKKYADKVVVTYKALTAMAPKDCNSMPGNLGGEAIDAIDEYRFGCDTRIAISKMIADPSDLMGKNGTQNSDSRRSATIIEKYQAGTPYEKTIGTNASTVGN
jgi:type IV pilus biogenesis protein CpaD/CtpE